MSENTNSTVVGNANGGNGRKVPVKSGLPKLRWTGFDGGKIDKAVGQQAKAFDATYKLLTSADGTWKATFRFDGRTTVLADGLPSINAAYWQATHHYHWNGGKPGHPVEVEAASA